jgi:hypothetical protein
LYLACSTNAIFYAISLYSNPKPKKIKAAHRAAFIFLDGDSYNFVHDLKLPISSLTTT